MGAVMEKSSRQNWNILFVTPSPPHRVFPPIFKFWNLQFLVRLPQNENLRKFLPLFKCESLTFGKSSDLFTITRYNLILIYLFLISLSTQLPSPNSSKDPSSVEMCLHYSALFPPLLAGSVVVFGQSFGGCKYARVASLLHQHQISFQPISSIALYETPNPDWWKKNYIFVL